MVSPGIVRMYFSLSFLVLRWELSMQLRPLFPIFSPSLIEQTSFQFCIDTLVTLEKIYDYILKKHEWIVYHL